MQKLREQMRGHHVSMENVLRSNGKALVAVMTITDRRTGNKVIHYRQTKLNR